MKCRQEDNYANISRSDNRNAGAEILKTAGDLINENLRETVNI